MRPARHAIRSAPHREGRAAGWRGPFKRVRCDGVAGVPAPPAIPRPSGCMQGSDHGVALLLPRVPQVQRARAEPTAGSPTRTPFDPVGNERSLPAVEPCVHPGGCTPPGAAQASIQLAESLAVHPAPNLGRTLEQDSCKSALTEGAAVDDAPSTAGAGPSCGLP